MKYVLIILMCFASFCDNYSKSKEENNKSIAVKRSSDSYEVKTYSDSVEYWKKQSQPNYQSLLGSIYSQDTKITNELSAGSFIKLNDSAELRNITNVYNPKYTYIFYIQENKIVDIVPVLCEASLDSIYYAFDVCYSQYAKEKENVVVLYYYSIDTDEVLYKAWLPDLKNKKLTEVPVETLECDHTPIELIDDEEFQG